MSKLHIIAEAGTNHNASEETGRKLIDVAADAGADSVKFQIIYPEGLYVSKFYRDGTYEENEVIAVRRAGMLSDDEYRRLAEHARERNLPLSASVFDERGLRLLDEFDPPYIKIASCDLNNSRLLKQSAELGRRLIVSTGMASLGEVERAVRDITSTGHNDLILMHCVSVYPCPTERMNLGFIRVLQTAFGFPVGLSDHTESSLAAAVGVAFGVEWIEKHFTLDRNSAGFDHAYAMEPEMLKAYISDVRAVTSACQLEPQKVGEAEEGVKVRARRSLFAARDIQPGETVAEQDVLILRPEGPLTPHNLDQVLGKKSRRTIRQFEPLSLGVVE